MGHLTNARTRLIGLGFGVVLLSGCGAAQEPGRLLLIERTPFDVAGATDGRLQSLSTLVRLTLTPCPMASEGGVQNAHGATVDAATRLAPHWLSFASNSPQVVAAIDAPPVQYCQAFLEGGPFFGRESLRYEALAPRTSTLAFDRLVDVEDPYSPTSWLPQTIAVQHRVRISVDADAFAGVFNAMASNDELAFEAARALSSSLRVTIQNTSD